MVPENFTTRLFHERVFVFSVVNYIKLCTLCSRQTYLHSVHVDRSACGESQKYVEKAFSELYSLVSQFSCVLRYLVNNKYLS